MKQIFQSLSDGEIEVVDLPLPTVEENEVLIRNSVSLISAGTERMLVNFGKSNFLGKAKKQPEKVAIVRDKIKTDGLFSTLEKVFSKLSEPIPLGYSSVGVVSAVGASITHVKPGDRVVSNGGHAEFVSVPKNLVAKVPDTVSDEEAAFTVTGAIALNGVRLLKPTLGETVIVFGLGLIGQLATQLLIAHGCRVLAFDLDEHRVSVSSKLGVASKKVSSDKDLLSAVDLFCRGRGADGVLICLSTDSDQPIKNAANISRKGGRIVLIGETGISISRSDFYEKELSFQVSCSYGPGRYDLNYETKGVDYPINFVRWTVQRNFEAVLDMLALKKISVNELISCKYPIERAIEAYETILSDHKAIGVLFQYSETNINAFDEPVKKSNGKVPRSACNNEIKIGFIGAGAYARGTLIPAFVDEKVELHSVASQTGRGGYFAKKKFGIIYQAANAQEIIDDKNIGCVVITTRHDTHSKLIVSSLMNGKSVFVEKPLCISIEELENINKVYNKTQELFPNQILMVGFNRRFSPLVQKMRLLLDEKVATKSIQMTVNAGVVPLDHWTQDRAIGGGRIIGEVCHFIDLMRFLIGANIVSHQKVVMTDLSSDTLSINLKFSDGSIGSLNYFSNGSSKLSKERVEIFCDGGVLSMDNYRTLRGIGWSKFRKIQLWKQDKGQKKCVHEFVDAILNEKEAPIPFDELIEVTSVSLEIAN